MVNDELMILGNLDQSLPVNTEDIFAYVDKLFEESIEKKNPHIVIDACSRLIAISQLSGLALAKMFYLLHNNWNRYEQDSTFEEIAVPKLGRHPHTIERYIKVWTLFDQKIIPEKFVREFEQKNIQNIIPVANAYSEGYNFEDEDWEEIADAPDNASVLRVVRDVKGEPPKSHAIQLFVDGEGFIYAYSDNERYFIGSLEIQDDTEIVQKAINRIMNKSGIMKK